MKKEDFFSYFKIPYLFQDVMCLMSGFILLFILNFLIKFDIDNIPNYSEISNVVGFLILFSIAYFSGRLGLIIGNLLIVFFKKALLGMFVVQKKQFFSKIIKETFQDFKLYIIRGRKAISSNNDLRHEIECFIHSNEYLRFEFERSRYHVIFLRLLVGHSFIIFVLIKSWEFFILILVILLYSIHNDYVDSKEYIKIGGDVLKNKNKK